MSRYDDYEDYERPRRRRGGARTREPEYIASEEMYIQKGPGARDLVLRGREDDYGAIDHRRDSYRDDYGPPRRARSHGVRDRDSYYGDDYYSDYNPRARHSRHSRDDDQSYYSDDYDRPRERRKSRVEGVLDDIGLGGVVAAVVGKSRSRSRRRRRDGDDFYGDRSRSHSRGHDSRKKWQQAAKAAVISGVIEAVRSRKEPGGWTGAKGSRVAVAALGAAGIDGLIDRDPDHRSKRHIVESVVGGLAANHLANGPREGSRSRGRSQSRSRSESRGRSRSQSQTVMGRLRSASRSVLRGRSSSRGPDRASGSGSGPGIKDLAALGGVAAIGKAVYDRVRSKSRGRLGRDRSASSDDSYVPSRRQRYGQNNGNRSRGGPDRGYGPTDEQKNQRQVMKRGRQAESATGEADDDGDRAARGGNNNNDKNHNRSSSSSSVSTTDLERRRKKTRGKELLTAGLATVATIHAAHGVYNSMVASEKRHKMVMEGEMSPDEARKRKSKNMLQDAAAVGIAALGIKSAYSEWKEMNESRKEKHELEARHRRHKRAGERREREMKERQLGFGQGGGGGGYGMPAYGDANPYHAYTGATYPGNFPPPPGGGPPR